MLLTKILRKLKKKQKTFLLKSLLNTYFGLSTPNESRVSELIHYASPTLLRTWLEKNKSKLDDQEHQKYLSLIDKYDPNISISPKKPLKIAVCISGEPRSFNHCIDSMKRFFYGHDVDFFIANKSSIPSQELQQQYGSVRVLEYADPDFSHLERSGIEKFGFIHLKHDVTIPVANTNIYPMWYGIQRSFEALTSAIGDLDQYDAICRCRFDTYFRKPLDIEFFSEDRIFIDEAYNEHGGYSDQFAIGHPKAMQQYFNLFDWFTASLGFEFGEAGYLPERILKVYLEDACHLHVSPLPLETRLMRDEYIGLVSHEIPLKSNTFNLSRNRVIQSYIKNKYPDLYPD